jgi:FG-GAP-like repeat
VCVGKAGAQSPFFVPPSFVGNSQTVTADLNGDGKPDLVSANGTVLLGKGDGTFTTGTSLSVTGTSIAEGDFNGDGKADLIIASSSTVLSVLLGNGDGTFQAAVTVNAGAALKSMVVGDFNGDGKLDVAGVNDTSGLFVLLGAGTGSFNAASGSPITIPANTLLVAGDFNGDGKIDLAYASSPNSGLSGGVFLSNGDGTFTKGSSLTIGLASVVSAGAADLNGDGKLDLVFSASTSSTNTTPATVVLLGNGDGTFQAVASHLASGGTVAIGDFNGDHKPDLVVDDGTVVNVALGNGDGTFSLYSTYLQDPQGGASGSSSVLVADFNGDGKLDVAAKGLMLLGNGDGSLKGNDAIVFAGSVQGGVAGDFNGDGSPDIVTSDGSNVKVLLNDGTGKFVQAYSYANSAIPIMAADFNHDGKLDLLLEVPSGSLALSVMFGNGDGTFQAATSTNIADLSTQSVSSIQLVDLNGDQIPDLVLLTTQGVSAFLGKGDGTFSAGVNYFAGSSPTTLQVGDFNNDGKADVAVGSAAGIGVLPGKGDGTFGTVVLSGTGPIAFSAAGDVNGDGKLDLVGMGSSLVVYLGNGDGTFQAALNTAPNGPINGFDTPLYLADVNGDGKLDAVAGTGIWYVPGNGDGTFGSPISVVTGNNDALGPFIDAVADFNGDGQPDVLITTLGDQSEQGFATFLNVNGAIGPNFAVAVTPVFPGSVELGDSATSSVTVTTSNGFSANVALACLGLPAGSSCLFSPATSGASSVTSTLTISVGSTTASGTYYVSVVGTGGGLTRSRLLTLIVSPGTPDFVLSTPSAATATVTAGTPATYSLSIGGSGGFSGNVALSCSGAPMGAVCTISPSSVMVSGGSPATATVTVTTTARSEVVMPVAERGDRWTPRIYGSPRFEIISIVLLLSLGLFEILESKRRRLTWLPIAAGALLFFAGLAISGCGGGNMSTPSGGNATGTPAGSYNITVTGTTGSGSNAVTHTTQVTLVVQ